MTASFGNHALIAINASTSRYAFNAKIIHGTFYTIKAMLCFPTTDFFGNLFQPKLRRYLFILPDRNSVLNNKTIVVPRNRYDYK